MCLHCLYVSWLSLSSNSGSVEMWKYVFIVLIYLVTLKVWKCGIVEMWNCGNMSSLSSSRNLEVWKCENVEICLHCLCLITPEVWKCGNMSSLSLSSNSGSLEVWKCENMSSLSLFRNFASLEVWKCGNMSSLS